MNLDIEIAEILSSKSYTVRKEWYRTREQKQKGFKFDEKSKSYDFSCLIDRLNEKIKSKK